MIITAIIIIVNYIGLFLQIVIIIIITTVITTATKTEG